MRIKEFLQSTQERIGQDWHHYIKFITQTELQMKQLRERLPHSSRHLSNCELGTPRRSIRCTRLPPRRSSIAMKLFTPDGSKTLPLMIRGKVGQTSSVSLAGVVGLQKSSRLRRRDDPKTTRRHCRHTCTSDSHACTVPGFFQRIVVYPQGNKILLVELHQGACRLIPPGLHHIESVNSRYGMFCRGHTSTSVG